MSKIYIPFMESGSKIPLIEFDIDDNQYVALVDTGSESTLFDKSIPESENYKISETDYEMSLVGLSGETGSNRVTVANAIINIKDHYIKGNNEYTQIVTMPVEAMITDLSYVSNGINERYGKHLVVKAILGSDFLKKYGAKIDYRRKQLSIRK